MLFHFSQCITANTTSISVSMDCDGVPDPRSLFGLRPAYQVSFVQRCIWTLVLAGYYVIWIYLTEKFIEAQKLPIIGASEHQFTQGQVCFPFWASYSPFLF
jgi:hypothetical protein